MRGAAIAALLTVLVSSTHANMGTAIVVAATGHFLVCNPIIALLEAALLTRWAKIPFTRGLPLMIAANYLSFFVGLLLGERISLTLGGVSQMLLGDDVAFFRSLPFLLGVMAILLFALTALLEALPLYLAQKRDWQWVIGNSARVNLVSYGLLVLLYLSVSDFGFLRNRFQPDLHFVQTVPAAVYYITPEGELASISVAGGTPRLLGKQIIAEPREFQFVYSMPVLQLVRDSKSGHWWLATKAERLFRVKLNPHYKPRTFWGQGEDNLIRNPDWRDASAEWSIRRWWEPAVYQGRQYRYSTRLVMPFSFDLSQSMGVFPCRAVSLLPGDYAVMELGGRIWVLHLPTRRIGLLAKGYMPIAVITEQAGQG